MQKFLQLLFCAILLTARIAIAQSVIDPNDPIVRYTGGTLPAQPVEGQIGKWISRDRSSEMPNGWKSTALKAYIYRGMAFRVQFPKTYNHTANDGKKYPVFVFFAGRGEAGPIQDNEYQLYHGGYLFSQYVTSGAFDGFLIYPQSISGYWTDFELTRMREILDYMAVNNKLDLLRVIDNGLSSGGAGTWDFQLKNPSYVAGCLPMSSAGYELSNVVDKFKFTPVWLFQGQLDGSPSEWTATAVYNDAKSKGANMRYTIYPNVAHDTWYHAWAEADFLPFMNRAHILTPWPLGGRSEFCQGDPIDITVGIAPGFAGYKWQRNGVLIDTAHSNQIKVNSLGVYRVSVTRDGTNWTEYSPTPLNVKIKAPTQTPPITTKGLKSNLLPAPDGSTTITLRVPSGYVNYTWTNQNNQVVSTDSTFTTSVVGTYTARVTEQYGCSSNPSAPFAVINAVGPNGPDGIQSLTATPVSKTELRLDWTDKATPVNNETLFEVYRSRTSGGPYTLVAKVPADVVTYTDNGLLPNTDYFYVIRPVNNNAAGPVSSEVRGITIADPNPPTAPTNLRAQGVSAGTSIPLAWDASTDDVGIAGYDVYVDGVKNYTTDSATRTIILAGLNPKQTYTVYVIARDVSGNSSSPSAQLAVSSVQRGWNYSYYETGSLSQLPNFNTLTPVKTGYSTTTDLSVRNRDDNFAFKWTGYLRIPVSGTYYFQTVSDDGSKLYLNTAYSPSATAIVNNDGLHGETTVTSSGQNLTAGQIIPITATFFEAGGDEVMRVLWRRGTSGAYTEIDPAYLVQDSTATGTVPNAPGYINAVANSYKSVTVTWKDNSTNEEAFEVYRSTTQQGTFQMVGRVNANVTTFTDNQVLPATRYYYRVAAASKAGTSAQANSLPYSAIWKFNGNASDSSYFANHAATVTNVTWSNTAKSGQSAQFNGTSTSQIAVTSTYLRTAYTERTYSMWIYPTATGARQLIMDQGGRGNGIALQLDGSILKIAAGTGGTNTPITVQQTGIAINNWYHVIIVYKSGSRLTMYVNGVATTSSSNTSSIAGTSAEAFSLGRPSTTSAQTATAFNVNNLLYYSGRIDDLTVIDYAVTATEAGQLYNGTLPINTVATEGLPAAPTAPGSLAAALDGHDIKLTFTDNATTETKFELQRSIGAGNTDYRFVSNIDSLANSGTTATYTDTSVFANETYNYRVRAVNDGGASAFSNIASATAPNNPPVIQSLVSRTIRYDNPIQIPLVASDPDGDSYSFSFVNLPLFVMLVNGPNGPYLNVATDDNKQGTYLNNVVIVTDAHGAKDTATFALVINDNYPPVLNTINDVNMKEGDTKTISFSATDQDANNTYTWTGENMPSFVTLQGNGLNCTATIKPFFTDAGTYNVSVRVTDNNGGTDIKTFKLVVSKASPNGKVLIDMTQVMVTPPGEDTWNLLNTLSASNLKNAKGEVTNIGVNIQADAIFWGNNGPQANNLGVYPDVVLWDLLFFGVFNAQTTVPITLTGLDTSKVYSLKFHAGSEWNGDNAQTATIFSVGTDSIPVYQLHNTTQTANFYGLKPDATGTLRAAASRNPAITQAGFINVIELGWSYTDNLAPAAPANFTGNVAGGYPTLNWTDVAYNETSYQVYRSTDSLGSYSLIKSTLPDANTFLDSSAVGNNKYYYKVRAFNNNGGSVYTNIVGLKVPNRNPVLDTIADVKLRAGTQTTVTLHATDDAADVTGLTFTAAGLPSFVTFTDGGSGNGQLVFNPTIDHVGSYNITITAKDTYGGSSSKSFKLFISDRITTLTYFNIAAERPAPAPWNNVMYAPVANAGVGIANTPAVVDENNSPNGMSFRLNDAFGSGWWTYIGMNTGQNVGIVPDTVMQSAWYMNNGNDPKNIEIAGLQNNLKYNFAFFVSQNYGGATETWFVINQDTVKIKGNYNIGKTSQINGISPVNGKVNIRFIRPGSLPVNAMSFLNALIVESYDPLVSVVSPAGVRATALDSKRINLTWSDRSNNETGFQVWRRAGLNGTETQVATLAANTTEYSDNNLSANTQYAYRIRAVKSGVYSDYSGAATATTYAMNVYIHFSDTSVAPFPWNNTGRRPQVGIPLISNALDDNGAPTSVGVEVLENFLGVYGGQGMYTGNNSGVYPDAVLAENYVLFGGGHASMKITGLNQAMTYNLTVFSSARDLMNCNTRFTANGKLVTWLNSSINTVGTATIYNVTADANGEIKLDVDAALDASYGLMGALVIQGFTPTPLGTTTGSLQSLQQNNVMAAVAPANIGSSSNTAFANLTAFPNPFVTELNLDMTMTRSSRVLVEIFDLNGRLVYSEQLTSVPQGKSTLRLNTGSSIQIPGYYLIRLTDDQRQSKVIRTIKQ
ncbi:Fibronectin type III domain-containing protein [Chitinophaga jiangningensis]|uniref:Fibronectin type III domain-containing protein n=1 Tax=Chitinophaga jiangningensis TaxID=1419482 RepID=A0A1M7MPM1_9BACT|nr:fibronectin type III domain-containing protein [Chitinophaga jiangningensis]SHM92875.1 Fibronectin type III domain-containing protein [Chitinophaga jiangningensis]